MDTNSELGEHEPKTFKVAKKLQKDNEAYLKFEAQQYVCLAIQELVCKYYL